MINQFEPTKAYAEHYLSAEEPEMEILQSLYSSELVTHRVVCLPKRRSDIEGAWSLNDDFFFECFDNGISPSKSRNTRLPLDFFFCRINDELARPRVADCHFFLEQIDPSRRIPHIGSKHVFYEEELFSSWDESLISSDSDRDSDSDSDSDYVDDSGSDDEV